MSATGWIGVDLDGTLAHYDEWRGPEHVGAPIPLMVERVKKWLSEGKDVRIFTARLAFYEGNESEESVAEHLKAATAIQEWCRQHLGQVLPITHKKDFRMIELWDDRAVQVFPNTGIAVMDAVNLERR